MLYLYQIYRSNYSYYRTNRTYTSNINIVALEKGKYEVSRFFFLVSYSVAKVHSLNQCSKCKRVNYGYSYG